MSLPRVWGATAKRWATGLLTATSIATGARSKPAQG